MEFSRAFWCNVLGASVLCAGVVYAQGPGGPGGGRGGPSPLLNALDTNHDGKLSAEEITAAPKSLLKLDVNGDGSITADELQAPPESPIASPDDLSQQLMAFDKNHDGVLTRDELPDRLQPLFTRADANKDGKVTPEELRALAAKQTLPTGSMKQGAPRDPLFMALDTDHDGTISAAEIAASSTSLLTLDKNHDGEIADNEMRPPQASPAEQADHIIGENDTNKDGRISKAEAPEFLQGQFAVIDKNGDGYIDRDELIAYFGSNAGGPRGGRPGGGQGERPMGPPPQDNH